MSNVVNIVLEATDGRDLARKLGSHCLDNKHQIDWQLSQAPSVKEIFITVEDLLLQVPMDWWTPAEPSPGSLADILNQEILDCVDVLEPTPHLDCLALLRGVCLAVLVPWFEGIVDVVELERGDPFPLPVRPMHKLFQRSTPSFATTRVGDLLIDFNFSVYRGGLGKVRMNFEQKEQVDLACWIDEPMSLPSVALIFPYASSEAIRVPPDVLNDDWWFGVGPTSEAWDAADIITQLKSSVLHAPREPPCRVGLLPELSLPDPDALSQAIRQNWKELPSLLVAGSAHVAREGEGFVTRANESVVYLNGVELFRHRKRHPFRTKAFRSESPAPLPEGLTPTNEFNLASGNKTRLAVLICADAMDSNLVSEVQELGVNFLLVPALSPDLGGFTVALSGVPAACQGISIVINGSPPGVTAEPLFVCLLGVPDSRPTMQTAEFFTPEGMERRGVCILNLNANFDHALTWL